MNIPLEHTLLLGAALFALGAVGFLTRRNLISLFLCAELMLQGVAVSLVAFSCHHGQMQGQVFAMFVVTVAACEAGVALALILMLYRSRRSLDVSLWQELRDPDIDAAIDVEALPASPAQPPSPVLAVAGRLPEPRTVGAGHE